MEKKDIVSYNYDELQDEIKSIGEKPFRAKQIYAWLHEKLAEEFDEMTNLSKALRVFPVGTPSISVLSRL